MIKVVLFDIDGVVLSAGERFSSRLSNTYGIPMEKIDPFFKNEFPLCETGHADIKQELGKYLDSWKWRGTVDELLDFWFKGEDTPNHALCDDAATLKDLDIKRYLHTNNEKYRVSYLWDTIGLKHGFDGIFSSADLGALKPARAFWEIVQSELGDVAPAEVVVWDDDVENVASASEFGYHAKFYSDFQTYQEEMNRLIPHRTY